MVWRMEWRVVERPADPNCAYDRGESHQERERGHRGLRAYSDRLRVLHVQLLLALGGVSDGDDEPRDALTQERLAHLVVAGGYKLLDARLVILRR